MSKGRTNSEIVNKLERIGEKDKKKLIEGVERI